MVMQADLRKVRGISTEIFKQIETVENKHDASTTATLKAVERWGTMVVYTRSDGREMLPSRLRLRLTGLGSSQTLSLSNGDLYYNYRLEGQWSYKPPPPLVVTHQSQSSTSQYFVAYEYVYPKILESLAEKRAHLRICDNARNAEDKTNVQFVSNMASNMKKFALIFWVKGKNTSVISMAEMGRDLSKGEELRLPFGGRSYLAKVLECSEDEKWLRKINVSEDGDIICAKKKENKQKRGTSRKKKSAARVETERIMGEKLLQDNSSVKGDNVESCPERAPFTPTNTDEDEQHLHSERASATEEFAGGEGASCKERSLLVSSDEDDYADNTGDNRRPCEIEVSDGGEPVCVKKQESKQKSGANRKKKTVARAETTQVRGEKLFEDNSSDEDDKKVSCQKRASFIPSDTDEAEQHLRSRVGQHRKEKHSSGRASPSKKFGVSPDEDTYADNLKHKKHPRETEVSEGCDTICAKKQGKKQKRESDRKKKKSARAETVKAMGEKCLEDNLLAKGDKESGQKRASFIPSDTDEDEQSLRSRVGQLHSKKEKHHCGRASQSKEFGGGEGPSCKGRALLVSSDQDDYADKSEDNGRPREIEVSDGGEPVCAKTHENKQKRGADQKKKNAAGAETVKDTGEKLFEDNSFGEGGKEVSCQKGASFIPSDTDDGEQRLRSRVGQHSKKEKHRSGRASPWKKFGVSSDEDNYGDNSKHKRFPRETEVSEGGDTVCANKPGKKRKSESDQKKKKVASAEMVKALGEKRLEDNSSGEEVSRRKRPLLMYSDDEDDKPPRRSKLLLQDGGQENDGSDKTSVTKEAGISEEMLEPIIAKILQKLINAPKGFPKASEPIDPRPSTSRLSINLPQGDDELKEYPRTRRNAVEIQPDSGVYVDRTELQFLSTRWKTNPKMLARKLMLYLVGAAKLKKSTALGTGKKDGINGWEAIPSHILDAVKYYIDQRCIFKLSPADYNRAITLQCGTLRHPHKSSDKKEKENKKDGSQDEDSE